MVVDQQEEMTRKLNFESHAKAMAKLDALIERAAAWTGGFFAVNYCAPHGYAKSMLLARVWETYQGRIPVSRLALRDFVTVGEPLARVKLLESVINELVFRVSQQILAEGDIAANYAESSDADELAAGIVSLVKAAAHFERVTLLLLDDYDALLATDRRWFESQVLGQLSAVARFGVVMTSQTPLRFDRVDLRAGLQIYPLLRLTADDVGQAFPQYRDLYPQIERLTGGLPTLTGELVAQLEQSPKEEVEELRERQDSISRKFFRNHVEQVILNDLRPTLQRTLQVLALLRRFDVPTLAALLPRLLPDIYNSYAMPRYVDLLAELNTWIQWRAEGGYALNQAYALALRGYVMAERPDLWQKAHQVSRDYYRSLLASGQYQRHYLVEALYHRLSLLQAEGKSEIDQQKTVSGELLAAVQAEPLRAAILADAGLLRETLTHDSDLGFCISEEALDRLKELEQSSLATSRTLSLGRAA